MTQLTLNLDVLQPLQPLHQVIPLLASGLLILTNLTQVVEAVFPIVLPFQQPHQAHIPSKAFCQPFPAPFNESP